MSNDSKKNSRYWREEEFAGQNFFQSRLPKSLDVGTERPRDQMEIAVELCSSVLLFPQ